MTFLVEGSDAAGTGILSRGRLRRHLVRFGLGLAVLVVAFAIRSFAVEPVHVSSLSMAPTLQRHDVVLVQKVGDGPVRRRDIVAFTDPIHGALTVKRVVAIAGDVVEIRDAVLQVNGQPVPEPAVDYRLIDGLYFGPARVPSGTVFLMGDNRGESIDSRSFGPVPLKAISGHIVLRAWPPGRLAPN
jgi:signal peptidase I